MMKEILLSFSAPSLISVKHYSQVYMDSETIYFEKIPDRIVSSNLALNKSRKTLKLNKK